MDNINQLATFKALEQSRISRNAGLLDHLLRDPESGERMGLKRVIFETIPDVVDQLESVCNVLGVSKREFLEAALCDALGKAETQFSTVYLEATGHEFGELVED